MQFKYCSECGEKLILKEAGDDGFVPFCNSCNKYYFDIFPSCVIVLVANEFDEIVLLRQSYLSDKYHTFVAGYMCAGENAETAAKREVKEEIGLDIDSLDFAGTYWFEQKGLLMLGFIARVKKSDFVLSKEVDSAKWAKVDEVPALIFPKSSENAAYYIYEKFVESNLSK